MRPRLLYLLHCYFNRAGTEQHVRTLRQGISTEYDLYLLFRDGPKLLLMDPTERCTEFPADPPQWPLTPLLQARTAASVSEVLRRVSPQLIHVQHFHNWHLGVLEQLSKHGCPCIITFHDYYALTPIWTMQGVQEPKECFSKEYAQQMFGQDVSDYLARRFSALRALLQGYTLRLAPSAYTAHVIGTALDCSVEVLSHGIEPFSPRPRPKPSDNGALHFGYLGSLLPQKGWQVLLKAFQNIQLQYPKARLSFYGGRAPSTLSNPSTQIRFAGVYEQQQLAEVTSKIEVGIIPSIFPESFCLTLSELWHAGVPVAAASIGALIERVEPAFGSRFKPDDVGALEAQLRWFLENEEWRQWKVPAQKTATEMCDEYKKIYLRLLDEQLAKCT